MRLSVLTTTDGKKLAKTITRTDAGWTIDAYDRAWEYSVDEFDFETIEELSALLTFLEGQERSCVIRGEPLEGVDREKVLRRLHTYDGKEACFRERPEGTGFVMIDVDEWEPYFDIETPEQALEWIVSELPQPFQNASYHYQWSSKAGLHGWKKLYAHLFFVLEEPWLDSLLHERVYAEEWGFDPAPIRTVQPNYTAAPIFTNCEDPLEGRRSGLVKKSKDKVLLDPWIRPMEAPRPVYEQKIVQSASAEERFEEKLAAIGNPSFHDAINRAIAFYVGVYGQETDDMVLLDRVKDAVISAGGGYRHHGIYLKNNYLTASIKGAKLKFGR